MHPKRCPLPGLRRILFVASAVFALILPTLVLGQDYVRIKNRWTGEYLYASGEMCLYVQPHARDWAGQWQLVDVPGTSPAAVKIRNRETGRDLDIGGALTWVECVAPSAGAASQRWWVETYGAYKRIRSVVTPARYFHTENRRGYAQHGPVSDAWQSAQWTLEPVTDPTPLPRGGQHPWITREAEDMVTNGTVLGPSRMPGAFNFASEASGRKCVRLDAVGRYVQFAVTAPANALVVRAAIPDAPAGGGRVGTLSLYVNGTHRADFTLSSEHSYIYNYEQTDETLWSDLPSAGEVSRFYFDESRLLLSDLGFGLAVGDVVKLQIDPTDIGADAGEFCILDFVELEQVAPASAKPSSYYSITDYGAVANDGLDDTASIKACLAAAKAAGVRGIWIPKGVFHQNGNIPVADITIKGAGMWHSRLVHTLVEPYANRTVLSASITAVADNSGPVRIHDLALSGSAPYDQTQSGALRGRFGDGSVFQNLWIERQQVGMWLAHWPATGGNNGQINGLFIDGCRIRNTFADGINLCTSARNATVVNCHVRGTQDDAFAQWSNPSGGFFTKNNTFKHCHAQLPLRGNGFAVYGGENTLVAECRVTDTLLKCGVIASSAFNMVPFVDTVFRDLDLVRCGGYLHTPTGHSIYGAIGVLTRLQDIDGVVFSRITVSDPTYYGVHFLAANSTWCIRNIVLADLAIHSASYHAIKVNSPVKDGGAAGVTCTNVVVTGLGLQNSSANFSVVKLGAGNTGW